MREFTWVNRMVSDSAQAHLRSRLETLPPVPAGTPVTEKGPSAAGLVCGRFASKPFATPPALPRVGESVQNVFARLDPPTVLRLREGEPVPVTKSCL